MAQHCDSSTFDEVHRKQLSDAVDLVRQQSRDRANLEREHAAKLRDIMHSVQEQKQTSEVARREIQQELQQHLEGLTKAELCNDSWCTWGALLQVLFLIVSPFLAAWLGASPEVLVWMAVPVVVSLIFSFCANRLDRWCDNRRKMKTATKLIEEAMHTCSPSFDRLWKEPELLQEVKDAVDRLSGALPTADMMMQQALQRASYPDLLLRLCTAECRLEFESRELKLERQRNAALHSSMSDMGKSLQTIAERPNVVNNYDNRQFFSNNDSRQFVTDNRSWSYHTDNRDFSTRTFQLTDSRSFSSTTSLECHWTSNHLALPLLASASP